MSVKTFKVTKKLASKVLETVDAGLCSGLGKPEPGKMCVEAAVCYAMGLPHGDNPTCVSGAVRTVKIGLNDSAWSSNLSRAKGMRRLAIAQLGTADTIDDTLFINELVNTTITKVVPRALRYAASIHPILEQKILLEQAAVRCEKEGTEDAARYAADAASVAKYAASVAKYAADAADAARYAADAAKYAADAARYAADAAWYAADAARYAAGDKELATFAEEIVQILIKLKAPGTKFLYLTEQELS